MLKKQDEVKKKNDKFRNILSWIEIDALRFKISYLTFNRVRVT
jgi:hypothetical protein